MSDIDPYADDQAGLQLLYVGQEWHVSLPTVPKPCRAATQAVDLPYPCGFYVNLYSKNIAFF
jgi:hypothetical protein